VCPKYWREIKRPSIMSEISIAPWNVVRMLMLPLSPCGVFRGTLDECFAIPPRSES
jgi:hypothetical protein